MLVLIANEFDICGSSCRTTGSNSRAKVDQQGPCDMKYGRAINLRGRPPMGLGDYLNNSVARAGHRTAVDRQCPG